MDLTLYRLAYRVSHVIYHRRTHSQPYKATPTILSPFLPIHRLAIPLTLTPQLQQLAIITPHHNALHMSTIYLVIRVVL